MRIEREDICIRDAGAGDCAQLAAWWNDGSVMAHAGFPLGLGTTAEEIRQKISSDSDDTVRRLILEHRGRPVGEANYRNKGGGIAAIGIKICRPEEQNRGLGRIVLSLLIRELFARGYGKIVLDTNANNRRAQHVYELLGFRRVRVNENSWTNQVGELQSSIDYELTPEDFQDFAPPA